MLVNPFLLGSGLRAESTPGKGWVINLFSVAPVRYHDQLGKEQPQTSSAWSRQRWPSLLVVHSHVVPKGALAKLPMTMLRYISLWHSKDQCEVENHPDMTLFLFSFNEESIKINAL